MTDDEGHEIPAQIVSAERGRDGGIREAHLACFLVEYSIAWVIINVFHATPLTEAARAAIPTIGDSVSLENDLLSRL